MKQKQITSWMCMNDHVISDIYFIDVNDHYIANYWQEGPQ
jgi:peroxiredoxin